MSLFAFSVTKFSPKVTLLEDKYGCQDKNHISLFFFFLALVTCVKEFLHVGRGRCTLLFTEQPPVKKLIKY